MSKFVETGKGFESRMTGRNRSILIRLRLKGQLSVQEIAKEMKISEKTVLTELKFMESKGFVKQVGGSSKVVEVKQPKKEVKVVEKRKGALDRWVDVV